MPAVSVCDPVAAAIRQSLDCGVLKSSTDDITLSLTSGASKILQSEVKYESTDGYQTKVLEQLKAKYIVLSLSAGGDEKGKDCLQVKKKDKCVKNGPRLPEPNVILYSPQKVQLGWQETVPVGAGMYNVGNTCYLNSTLQALFHVPALVNWLLSDSHHNSKCEQNGGGGECLTCAMSKTLQFSHEKSGNAIKPFYIYNKLKMICRTMVPGQQEDAHEFLRYLLEGMERAYLNRFKPSKLDSYSKETTPINQIFGGYIRTEVCCLSCHHISTTFQHFQDLLVDIRKANTLDEALSNYFSREQLDNNDYKCESCKRRVPATKQFTLEKPPKVLCVQLKRFSVLGGKISRHIGFKQTIDMGQYLWRENNDTTCKLNYKLMSIVTHMGPSVNCGHYTAVAQVSTGQYYSFDDSCVRSINFTNVMNTNPYIMIFEMEPSSEKIYQLTQQPKRHNSINNKTIGTNSNSSSPKGLVSRGVNLQNGTTKSPVSSALASSLSREADKPIIGPQLPPTLTKPSKSINFIGPGLPEKLIDSRTINGNRLVPYDDGTSDEEDSLLTKNNNMKTGLLSKNLTVVNNGTSNSNFNTNRNAKILGNEMIKSEIVTTTGLKTSDSPQKSSASMHSTLRNNGNEIASMNDYNVKIEVKNEINGKEKCQQSIKIKNCMDHKVVTKATLNGWEVSKDVPSPTSAATPNGWSVTDNNKEESKKLNHISSSSSSSSSSSASVPSAAAPRNFNGTNHSDQTVSHLLKMSNRGYGHPSVTNWNGNRTHLDREVDNERRDERKRHYNHDEEDYDRGKIKKIKSNNRDYNNGRSNPGYNPFQEYSNGKSWNRSNTSGYHRRNCNNYYNTSTYNRQRQGLNNNNYRSHYNRHNNNNSRDNWQRKQ